MPKFQYNMTIYFAIKNIFAWKNGSNIFPILDASVKYWGHYQSASKEFDKSQQ